MIKYNINLSIIVFTALLFVNNSNALESYHQIPFLPGDTVYICYITEVFSEAGKKFIKMRPVQFLWGSEAVIEAKKDGEAEYNIDTVTKDTNWYVPNDYHIVDREESEFKLIISDKVKVSICDPVELKKTTIKELHKKIEKIEYRPFEIAVENGKVTIIQEIYIP